MNKDDNFFDLFDDQYDDLFSGLPMAVEETPALQENMPLLNSECWYQDNDINTVLTAYLHSNDWLVPQKRFLLTDRLPCIVAITPAVDTSGSTPIQYFLDKNHQVSNSLSTILKEICERNLIQQLSSCQKSKRNALIKKLFPKEKDVETIKAIASALEEAKFDVMQLRNKIRELDAKNERADVFDEIMPAFMIGAVAHARILCPMSLSQRHWVLYEIVLTRNQLKYDITVTAHDPYGNGEVGNKELSLLQIALTKRITNFHQGIQPDITITANKSSFPPRQHPADKTSCGVIIIPDILSRIEGKPLGGDAPYPAGALSLRTAQYQHTLNHIFANTPEEIEGFQKRILSTPFAIPKKPVKEKSTSNTAKKRDEKKSLQDKRSTKKTKEDQAQPQPQTQPQPQATSQTVSFSQLLKAFAGDGFAGNLQHGYWTKDNHFIYFVDAGTQQALQKNNMDFKALFAKISELMGKQKQQGASHLKIIFFSAIASIDPERSEAYSGILLDYQLNSEKGQYEPSRFILMDPFHYKKYPNKPKLDSVPGFLSAFFQSHPSQVTILDKIGSRATKYALIMELYVLISYAFNNELRTEISEGLKDELVASYRPTLSTTIGNAKLLQIKDNHVLLPSTGFFKEVNPPAVSNAEGVASNGYNK